MRLTDRQYWDGLYKDLGENATTPSIGPESPFKRRLKRLLGGRLMDLMSAYDDYLLWQVVLPRYLPQSSAGLSVLEVGSAPGDFLVRFARTFGATPFGVEYSPRGAERNRAVFAAADLDPAGVIEADFLSDSFLNEYRNRFDIVISRGFIEHFEDADAVVARHVDVLRPGGQLIILIPNLRGIYYVWTRTFNPGQLPLHNLAIMQKKRFLSLFSNAEVDQFRCSYFGTFSFWMFTAPASARLLSSIIRSLWIVQRGLNLAFRLIFAQRGCESSIFSPNLLVIGKKAIPRKK